MSCIATSVPGRTGAGVGRVGAPKAHALDLSVFGIIDLQRVGVRNAGIIAAVHQHGDGEPGQIALGTARFEPVGCAENIAESDNAPEFRVAAAAGGGEDGFGTVLLLCLNEFVGNEVDGFVPGDALPLVFAAFADAEHGIFVAVGIVKRLDAGKAFGAHSPLAHGRIGVAFQLDHPAVFHRSDDCTIGNAGTARGLDSDDFIPLAGADIGFACRTEDGFRCKVDIQANSL